MVGVGSVGDCQDHPGIDNDHSNASGLYLGSGLAGEALDNELVGLGATPAIGGAADPGEKSEVFTFGVDLVFRGVIGGLLTG